jgi:hypothetical protein
MVAILLAYRAVHVSVVDASAFDQQEAQAERRRVFSAGLLNPAADLGRPKGTSVPVSACAVVIPATPAVYSSISDNQERKQSR